MLQQIKLMVGVDANVDVDEKHNQLKKEVK